MRVRPARAGLLVGFFVLIFAACGPAHTTGVKATATPGAATSTPTGTGAIPPGAITSGVPRFESAKCPFQVGSGFAEGKTVICGDVVVKGDRADANSPLFHLPVAIFHNSNAAAADPLIYLDGGPGAGGVEDFGPYITARSASFFMGDRDLVLFDERGTGSAQPSLRCTELDALTYETDVNVTPQQGATLQNQALQQCHTRLTGAGIKLSDFTTASNAADVNDIAHVLNYPKLNLWGISYGTRLALEVMRAYPAITRSVILDSTVPAQSSLILSEPADTARVFNTLFQGCANDAACNGKYPNLQGVFNDLVAQLDQTPITFQTQDAVQGDQNFGKTYTVLMHGSDLANFLFQIFYVTSFIPDMPKLIYEVKQGNYTDLLSNYYGQLAFDTSVSYGMYFSLECAEDVDFTSAAAIATASQSFPASFRAAQTIGLQGEYQGCTQIWNVPTVPASERQPVVSALPTLILEGEYDPVTPPSNGDLVAKTLSDSYVFLFKGTGHGVFATSQCAAQIYQAFIDTPTSKPDGSCLSSVTEPVFT